MKGFIKSIQSRRLLLFIYLANLFLSFHYYTTAYVNATFLGNSFSASLISIFYILAAILNITILFTAPKILNRFGNYRFIVFGVFIDLLAILGLVVFSNPFLIFLSFLIHQTFVSIIGYNLDIYLEQCTKKEGSTGELRGIFLTFSNIALVLSPFFLSLLNIRNHDFSKAYILATILLLPLIFITIFILRDFKDPKYHSFTLNKWTLSFFQNKNIAATFSANFLLQLFYSWMVIYVPLYLIHVIGFSFSQFALIMTIALLPFLLFELLVGVLADHLFGEVEMMTIGFVVMAIFVFLIPEIKTTSIAIAAFIMFMTRFGATLVEMTTESYFFKKMKGKNADSIGIFRMTRPLAYVVGPAIGIPTFYLLGNSGAFYLLSLIMLSGIFFSLRIRDTL